MLKNTCYWRSSLDSPNQTKKQSYTLQLFPKKAVISALVLSTLFLTSCSTKFTYNFLDWWMGWTIDDYVSLNKPQKTFVSDHIDQFHQWHRTTQLPLYAETLEQLQQDLSDPALTEEKLQSYIRQGSQYWDTSLEQLLEPGVQLAASLSEQQITNALKEFEKKRQEFYEKYAQPDENELQTQRASRMKKLLRSWIGRLTEEQKLLVDNWSQAVQSTGKQGAVLRKQWQLDLKNAFTSRENTELFQKQIKTLMFYPEKLWPKPYRESVAHNQQLILQLLVTINQTLLSRQQQKRNKTLQNYINDFRELARQS